MKHLWPLQNIAPPSCDLMIAFWVLGSLFTLSTLCQAPGDHVTTIYNLPCCHFLRGLPFVCLGWLKELHYAEILWQAAILIHLPCDPGDHPGDLLMIATESVGIVIVGQNSHVSFHELPTSLNYWDSSPTYSHDNRCNLVRILFDFIFHWTASSVCNSFQQQLLRIECLLFKLKLKL